MLFLHSIPPFKDLIEFLLSVYPIFSYFFHANNICILYLLYLHNRDWRWQLFPVYIALFVTVFCPQALHNTNLVAYAILTTIITHNFPMCSPLKSHTANVGVQDICFQGEKTDFWVRFYYPAAESRQLVPLTTILAITIPCIAISATSYMTQDDMNTKIAYTAVSVLIAYEQYIRYSTSRITYLPHGMTHENIANYARLPAFLFGHMNLMSIVATPDAPWSRDASLPVVLLLHGLGACRSTYTSIAFSLVEAGHIVLCPEFGDGTPCYTSLPDGQCRPYQSFDGGESGPAYHAFRADQLIHREIEVKLILKYMKALSCGTRGNFVKHVLWTNNGNEGFLSSLQTLNSSILLCGHSFGGATALHLATAPSCSDLRKEHAIQGVILLDPWMFPLSQELYAGKQILEYPTICLHADRFQWPENLDFESKVIRACTSSAVQIKIQNCGHVSYCEMALLAPYISAYLLRNTGKRDPLTCLHEICNAVKSFAESIRDSKYDYRPFQCSDFRVLYARSSKAE